MLSIRNEVLGVHQGAQFGDWSVLGKPFGIGGRHYAVVGQCKCGLIAVLRCSMLNAGSSSRCHGCVNRERTKHGASVGGKVERLYRIWSGMKARCNNPKSPDFAAYGGRGIFVCDEWQHNYVAFRDWAMAADYADNLELDRRDNSGPYASSNCRWVTSKTNNRNKRSNKLIEAFGETKCIAEWSEDLRCGVPAMTIYERIANGWSGEMALTQATDR